MRITKCDICKQTIEQDSKRIHLGLGQFMFSNHIEICLDCGKPILKLLMDKKVITAENKKYGK